MDVIGVPRVRTDQPVMPPVRSSGDTSRKVGVKGLVYLDESCPREFSIAVVKLIAEGVTGQAHGSLRGRHFGRLIMALDRLGRPMWCSRLPVSDSIAFLRSVLTAPSS
ncbi:hypothetical protein CN183_29090 [Sinorhizobium medicae]|nr:hypothetical protein CN183_29090 [Sinorhizobium medicae]RVJ23160.1 hypothetical protein CN179_25300 [Sinorhizobium medicae]